jgi:hypothetical protein
MKTQAPAFHGAKKQLHACLAQPGDDTFEMNVARTNAGPVHRRQMTNGVALMRVQHELRFCCRP